jgi:hypothetical protein
LAALVVGVLIAACSSSQPADPLLAAPSPGHGLQVRVESTVAAGTEVERCQYLKVGEALDISKIDIRYTQGVHHVAVWTMSFDEIPSVDFQGKPIAANAVFDCPGGPEYSKIVAMGGFAQTNAPAPLEFPPGVALRIKAGTVLLIDAHYINSSAKPIATDTRVNYLTMRAEDVREEVGAMRFYDPFIRIPANASGRARMACPITSDVTLLNTISHMHGHGTKFTAEVTPPGGTQEELFSNTEWKNVDGKVANKKLVKGSAIDFWCDYQNTTSETVIQGPTTKDEMCIFMGFYYPRDAHLENCSDGTPGNDGFAATWTGNGTTSCGDALKCAFGAKPPSEDKGESFYGCIVDACPAAATPLSNFVRCNMSKGYGKCMSECATQSEACNTCIQTSCGAEIGACMASTCN